MKVERLDKIRKRIKDEDKKCCLCGKHFLEWGNDPWPLKEEGICCNKCNAEKVLPARIEMIYNKKKETKDADPKQELQTLIKSEEEAIVLYDNAIKNAVNDKEKELYNHILVEEKEHLEMLKNYLSTGEIKIF